MNLGHLTRSTTLADQVIAVLRTEIVAGMWPVGSRIPTEPELVERFGVARNTVREAVRALAHNGLLDIRQGSGTYVVATSELAGVMAKRFAEVDPPHVAEVRGSLEATAAALAARRRDEADLRRLDALLAGRDLAFASGTVEAFAEADARLHQAVVASAHNEVLTTLYADLGEVLRDFRGVAIAAGRPTEHRDHAGLVAAIRAGDPSRAAAEAGDHAVRCRFTTTLRPTPGSTPPHHPAEHSLADTRPV
ncbi:FadR/GntR family transcriptional regulator [Streptomyces sp. NBC_01190]|uniref:FadR/GntR family transcriptional regulator n=1 Tax=Streptomyces sp. NBC_01190 TaxID=2903767 RepID=UPI00386AF6EF|nr:FCD domain-containing protein [Streptomyces sp. NBC_01190]